MPADPEDPSGPRQVDPFARWRPGATTEPETPSDGTQEPDQAHAPPPAPGAETVDAGAESAAPVHLESPSGDADDDTALIGDEAELLEDADPEPDLPTPLPSTTRPDTALTVTTTHDDVTDWADVSQLPLPDTVRNLVTRTWGIERLHPPQAEAMPAALAGTNLLLAIPTASGKSLVAYLAMLRRLLVDAPGSQAVYIVPLKALASEKVEELAPLEALLGLSLGLAIGDRSGEVRRVKDADILVCTSEKLDSLLRQDPTMAHRTSCVVVDELHLMDDPGRGPTLEVNLARLRQLCPDAQLIGLSATVGNGREVAEWLDAELITSTWRPVRLEYGTLVDQRVEPRVVLSPEEGQATPRPPRIIEGPRSDPLRGVLFDVWKEEGQLLVFVNSRRSAQSVARKLSEKLRARLKDDEPERYAALTKLADDFRRGEELTGLADELAGMISGGVAFHHAGLTARQRRLVEAAFRSRQLVGLAATPTLAAGVNLPARRVVIRDLKRYDGQFSQWLPVMEIQQMLGRAGRPRFDDLGEGWLLCKSEPDADEATARYLESDPEPVRSRLALEPPLRMHLLAAIATGGLHHREALRRFFANTFLGHTQPKEMLDDRIDTMLGWLDEQGFITRLGPDAAYRERLVEEMRALAEAVGLDVETLLQPATTTTAEDDEPDEETWDDELPAWARSAEDTSGVSFSPPPPVDDPGATLGFRKASDLPARHDWQAPKVPEVPEQRYEATPFGQLVARLYLDPLTASQLRDGLRRALRRLVRADGGEPLTDFGLYHLLTTTVDFTVLHPRQGEHADVQRKAGLELPGLLVEQPFEDELMASVKTAWVLESWTEEASLRQLEAERNVAAGDLRLRVQLAEWLLFAGRRIVEQEDEFAEHAPHEVEGLAARLDLLRRRIEHGCREDLLALVSLRGVGRVRGRQLASVGIRTLDALIDLDAPTRERLMRIRGWTEQRIAALQDQVLKLRQRARRQEERRQRQDDQPLEWERE